MPIGLSINIGLNRVDPAHYSGWDGPLAACEFDAQDMHRIAEEQSIGERVLLLSAEATSAAVTGAISDAAARLDSGDLLFLTYSGHGGQIPDVTGDESDGADETWCLFDRQLLDDELFALWSTFDPGVRIFVLSDSCHSGSVTRAAYTRAKIRAADRNERIKAMPAGVQALTYRAHRAEYDAIKAAHPRGDAVAPGAHVLLISGCRDDQESRDGISNGLFTETLLSVWNGGEFTGDYNALHAAIVDRVPKEAKQTPELSVVGTASPDFLAQRPLTV